MDMELSIDPEFEARCPPLTQDEFRQLEKNILEEGLILMPLIIWDNTIIDGHNRYRIAQKYPDISFRTHEKQFSSRYEALSWICMNQLGRRNLTPQQKKYLVGERYGAEKQIDDFHGNQYTVPKEVGGDKSCHHQNDVKTRKRIADETGISEGSVQNAYNYAKGVNAAEEVLPGIKDELLLGKIKPSVKEVAAIAKAPQEERLERAEKLREPKPPAEKSSENKRRNKEYEDIDRIYEELKAPKRVTEDSALGSLRYTAQNMIETCDVLFENFPGLLSESNYKAQVIEIMQEPKQYILKLEEL